MFIDAFLRIFRSRGDDEAIVYRDRSYSYAWMLDELNNALALIDNSPAITPGSVVALDADYSPRALAYFLALVERGCIIVPITETFRAKKAEFYEIAEVGAELRLDHDSADNDSADSNDTSEANVTITPLDNSVSHEITLKLKQANHPGIIIFSSGSTGKSKAAVHDCTLLMKKYETPRKPKRTVPFMLFDHIGGINTVLHTFSSGGTIIVLGDRTPVSVCRAIETHRVEVLPTSPTFLNLLLISGEHENYDLSSLEVLAYGAEPMPETTLKRLHKALPGVDLMQNYGLSEVGIMQTKSESSDSLWVKVGGDGYEFRVRDGILEIKSSSAMLGYLNAPNPFTEDGWFITGDMVEVKGDYIKILGRDTEIINVGGEKVYPAEVEGIIADMPGVLDVAVTSESHAITGNIVKAVVRLSTDESRATFRKRMAAFLADKLPTYKIPQKVALTEQEMHSDRFKKMRRNL